MVENVCELFPVFLSAVVLFYYFFGGTILDSASSSFCMGKRKRVFYVVSGFYEALYLWIEIGVVNFTVASSYVFIASFGYYGVEFMVIIL